MLRIKLIEKKNESGSIDASVKKITSPIVSEMESILRKYGKRGARPDVNVTVTENRRNSFLEYKGDGHRDWRYVGPGCPVIHGEIDAIEASSDFSIKDTYPLLNSVWEDLLKIAGARFVNCNYSWAGTKPYISATVVLPKPALGKESPASEARRYNYGAMTKDDFVRSAVVLYLKSLKRRKITPEDGYEIEDLMDTLSDSGLYLEEWVIAHIGLPKGEDEETYDAWMDDRPKVNAVIDSIMDALEEKGYFVE